MHLQRRLASSWQRQRKEQLLRVFLSADQPQESHPHQKVQITRQQDQAIDAALANFSVFLHLPTGAGKSLAYQLPALLAEPTKVTIVVSPLLALIQDQVANLVRRGIQAVQVSGDSSNNVNRRKTWRNQIENKQLIYTTPEFLLQNTQMRDWIAHKHRADQLERLVIDEAHCVVQWGNSFRPAYLELGRWKAKHCASVPVTLVSATVSEETIDTLARLFNVSVQPFSRRLVAQSIDGEDNNNTNSHPSVFKTAATQMLLVQEIRDRPNLRIEVSRKESRGLASPAILKRVGMAPTIVYCLTRNEAEKVCLELVKLGGSAGVYHGGLSMRRRDFVQKQWMGGQISIICATSAFGMGIDRPDVRFVVHYSIPLGLTSYYQQIGRAGRDGKPSTCWLLYSEEDKARAFALDGSRNDGQSAGNTRDNVEQMTSFCEDTGCRRQFVHNHFGYEFDASTCSRNCTCGAFVPLSTWVEPNDVGTEANTSRERDGHQDDHDRARKRKSQVEYLYHKVRAESKRLGLKKRAELSRRVIANILDKRPHTLEEMASLRGVGMEKAEAFFELFRRRRDESEEQEEEEDEADEFEFDDEHHRTRGDR